MKTVQITLTVPEQFHELVDAIAKIREMSIEEYIIDELIYSLGCALQNPMGWTANMSMEYTHDYGEQVRDLAYPKEAAV